MRAWSTMKVPVIVAALQEGSGELAAVDGLRSRAPTTRPRSSSGRDSGTTRPPPVALRLVLRQAGDDAHHR